jgi:hypothetical protein
MHFIFLQYSIDYFASLQSAMRAISMFNAISLHTTYRFASLYSSVYYALLFNFNDHLLLVS